MSITAVVVPILVITTTALQASIAWTLREIYKIRIETTELRWRITALEMRNQ